MALDMTQLNVTECSPGAVVGVLHVGHTHGGVTDSVVDHRVHRDCHTVLGQHLASLNVSDPWCIGIGSPLAEALQV